jgi:two-component system phosphate regulon response regulator PhoB
MKHLILLVSDDAEFYLVFSHILETAGYSCRLAVDVEAALRTVSGTAVFAVLIDCQPGQATGVELCLGIKGQNGADGIHVVGLLAASAPSQQVGLLQAGIDETFLRPFAPRKLLDFLRSRGGIDERLASEALPQSAAVSMELSPPEFRVRLSGRDLYLAPTEFRLLEHLTSQPGKVFSREELIRAAWPDAASADIRAVDVHIARLRKVLRQVSPEDLIRTVRSAGYTLVREP